MKVSVLSVAYDPALLVTRHLILEAEGYQVTSALGFHEALGQCRRGRFDLVVLGHSIPTADKKQLAAHSRAARRAPIVSLLRFGGPVDDGADHHISSSDPATLVQHIRAIVPPRPEMQQGPCLVPGASAHIARKSPYLQLGANPWISKLLTSSLEAMDADLGNVQLIDPGQGALRIVAQVGFDDEFLEYFDTVRTDDCACGSAMKTGSRIVVANVASHPIFHGTQARNVMLGAKARSVQSTPLTDPSSGFIGVVSTHWRHHGVPSRQAWERLDVAIDSFFANTHPALPLLDVTG